MGVQVNRTVVILNRDLLAAGLAQKQEDGKIDKKDERGLSLDVHSFRHTFATLLAAGGIPLIVRQRLMRHAGGNLTDDVYTDPKLLDTWGALEVLPELPLDVSDTNDQLRATGTDDQLVRALAPMLAPNLGKGCIPRAFADKSAERKEIGLPDVSDATDKPCEPLTTSVKKRATRLERATISLEG